MRAHQLRFKAHGSGLHPVPSKPPAQIGAARARAKSRGLEGPGGGNETQVVRVER